MDGPQGGGVLSYIGYMVIRGPKGYDFWAVLWKSGIDFDHFGSDQTETEDGTQHKFLKLSVVVNVLRKTQILAISRCCFAEEGKEMRQARVIKQVHSRV